MLDAGTVGETAAGSYFNVMDGVRRIVPRIPGPLARRTAAGGLRSWLGKLFGGG